MPRYWHDRHSIYPMEDEEERRFQLSICADKKPYFMRYIYPDLKREYVTYQRISEKNSIREFGLTLEELMALQEPTERQKDFIYFYKKGIPVSMNNCVMNRICRIFEYRFDGYMKSVRENSDFDYTVLKSDGSYGDIVNLAGKRREIRKLYEEYNARVQSLAIFQKYDQVDEDEILSALAQLKYEFKIASMEICQNGSLLCDIMLDICYQKPGSKGFVWEMCGGEIIANLLKKSGGMIFVPVSDPCGDILYKGNRYISTQICIQTSGFDDREEMGGNL